MKLRELGESIEGRILQRRRSINLVDRKQMELQMQEMQQFCLQALNTYQITKSWRMSSSEEQKSRS